LKSVLGLLLGNDNRPVVFSLWSCCWAAAKQWGGIFFGVRSEGIQEVKFCTVFQKRIMFMSGYETHMGLESRTYCRLIVGRNVTLTLTFGGAEIAQQRPAESMAGETSSRPTIASFEIL
jgi:hypothetical protein